MTTANVLRKIDTHEDIVIYKECVFQFEDMHEYHSLFERMNREGKISGEFHDPIWYCSSSIKKFELNFEFNEIDYMKHFKLESFIMPSQMSDILKCYALHICGEYIFKTIADKVTVIKDFITHFGNKKYKIKADDMLTISDFLGFIGIPEHQIETILSQLHVVKQNRSKQRELSNFINYLVIDNEISDMYASEISEEEFRKWFPIFFWTKITFLLPLRATEMLVTPFECIERNGDGVYIHVRRTMLKQKHNSVHYDVEKDYKIFRYRIPDNKTVNVIERYQDMTKDHERRFLFDYTALSVNEILSLSSFNTLLEEFINEHIIGNSKYDYARYATGIKEFEVVTAGDSRPIAMANLYYQDTGSDICRQLADHMNINTSAGYYTNVSNTVLASSVMQLQRKINMGNWDLSMQEHRYQKESSFDSKDLYPFEHPESCLSERQPLKTGDIADCVAEGHLEECLGCRYYSPTTADLDDALTHRKQVLDDASRAVIECMGLKKKQDQEDFDELFLKAHTGITRYRVACDEKAKETGLKWQRHKNTMTINC